MGIDGLNQIPPDHQYNKHVLSSLYSPSNLSEQVDYVRPVSVEYRQSSEAPAPAGPAPKP